MLARGSTRERELEMLHLVAEVPKVRLGFASGHLRVLITHDLSLREAHEEPSLLNPLHVHDQFSS